jgi:hypothetical protein
MGVFDQAARFAAQADPEAVTRRLLSATKTPLRFREWVDTRTLLLPGGTDRTADLVAALDDPDSPEDPWLMLMEFQAHHDPDKLDVTLEEVARLRLHARHGEHRRGKYRVLTALTYLKGRCPEAALEMALPEGFGTRHVALVWNIEEDSAETMLSAVSAGAFTWGILFWVPLMRGAAEAGVITRWNELAMAVTDRRWHGDLGKIALVFADLAGHYAAWEKALEGYEMTESNVVNRWVQEAREQARIEEARENLLRIVRRRFPTALTPEVVEVINTQPSLQILHDWFDTAIAAFSPEAFVAVLRR